MGIPFDGIAPVSPTVNFSFCVKRSTVYECASNLANPRVYPGGNSKFKLFLQFFSFPSGAPRLGSRSLLPLFFFFRFRAFAFFTTRANSPLNSLLEISSGALYDDGGNGAVERVMHFRAWQKCSTIAQSRLHNQAGT